MRLLEIGKRLKLIWLGFLVPVLILLSACGGGVSQEEFDAEQARAQELEVQAQALQQRLNRAAAVTEVLDTLTARFEEGASAEGILQVTGLVQASGDPQLLVKWQEIGASVQTGPPPQEAFSAMGAAVQESGIQEVVEKWQEVVAAVEKGGGAAESLEFAALVRDSGDPVLQAALAEFFVAAPREGNPPRALLAEFEALVEASGNTQIQEAFNRLGEPPPEVIEEVRAKLKALGDPSLEALFEAAYESGGEEFDAFFQAMLAAQREALQ